MADTINKNGKIPEIRRKQDIKANGPTSQMDNDPSKKEAIPEAASGQGKNGNNDQIPNKNTNSKTKGKIEAEKSIELKSTDAVFKLIDASAEVDFV